MVCMLWGSDDRPLGRNGPRAGEHEGHMGPRAGGFQALLSTFWFVRRVGVVHAAVGTVKHRGREVSTLVSTLLEVSR